MMRSVMLAALGCVAFSVGAEASTLTKTVEVFALENSTNLLNTTDPGPYGPDGPIIPQALATGVVLNFGDSFKITAEGLWSLDAALATPPQPSPNFYGPDGTTFYGSVNSINFGSLVGRIGNGAYFKVGSLFEGTAAAPGELFLAFFDNDFFNNGGSVEAKITYPGPDDPGPGVVPLPAGFLLSLTGLGALVVARRRRA